MENQYALGIDIGGTSTEYGVVNKIGEVIYEFDFPTKSFEEPQELVDAIYKDLEDNGYLNQLIGIGVGAPNGNYFTGNIEYAPNLTWKGIVPLAKMFEQTFGIPALLTNDANAAAMGEMLFGNAKDVKDFVTITLGTGVGSGVIVNGNLVYGHDGFAGEYGHIRIIPEGRLCGCTRRGCLETYCSSTGVVRSINELDSENKAFSSLMAMENPSAKNVFDEADQGDLFAKEIVEYTARLLGSALADYACFSSPKAYVLFGGIAQHGGDFAKKVKLYMEENMLVIYKNKIDIRVSSLHDRNAAVLGTAAHVFWDLKK
ncbi:MAG: ROK family protein [Crocinitomicaceae bacterium]|nr:MAG: ROK family protein [Crocinitomicaceae bacterium]